MGLIGRLLTGVAVLLLIQAAVILGGVYLMLNEFGDILEQELDDQVARVTRDFEQDLDRVVADVRRDLERELDERLVPAQPQP